MNNRLYDRKYLCGNEYTIADMISYPWTVGWEGQGQDIGEFKHFKRWFDEVGNRPAVKRGMETGNDLRVDPATLPPRSASACARSCTTSARSRRRRNARPACRDVIGSRAAVRLARLPPSA